MINIINKNILYFLNNNKKMDEEINKILNKKTKRTDFNNNTLKESNNYQNFHKSELKDNKFQNKNINYNNDKNLKINIKNIESNNEVKNNEQKNKKELDENRKIKIRKNALLNIVQLLNNNKDLKIQGEEFINNLAKDVEDELANSYPAIDYDYQKTLFNMNKTIKEISQYKYINQLIIKKKISLFTIAKFTYGKKFKMKLKRINNGYKNCNNDLNKLKNNLINNNKSLDNNFFFINEIKAKNENLNKNKKNQVYSPIRINWNLFDDKNNFFNYPKENEKIRIYPPLKMFSTITEEGYEHLYEPLSKEKTEYKVFIPISYDPTMRNINIKINKRDDYFNEKERNNNNKYTININSIDNNNDIINNKNDSNIACSNIFDINDNKIYTPPEGSVLRIFKGKIKMNHNSLKNVSLFSTDKYEKFQQFPLFEKEIILKSKVLTSKVIPYCIKHINDKSKLQLFGWLEPNLTNMNKNEQNIEINKFLNLIKEYDKIDKCSCLSNKKIKLYIFVLNLTNDNFNKKIIYSLDYINNTLKEYLEKEKKYLIFALLSSVDYLNCNSVKTKIKITPEIIKLKMIEKNEKPYNEEEISKANENEDDENEKFRKLFMEKDFDVDTYTKNNFGNLSEEEMCNKLLKLDEENRNKLLDALNKYSRAHPKNEYIQESEHIITNNINDCKINYNLNEYNNNYIPYFNNFSIPFNLFSTNSNLIQQINSLNNDIIQINNRNMNMIINNVSNGISSYYHSNYIFNNFKQSQ